MTRYKQTENLIQVLNYLLLLPDTTATNFICTINEDRCCIVLRVTHYDWQSSLSILQIKQVFFTQKCRQSSSLLLVVGKVSVYYHIYSSLYHTNKVGK